MMVYHIPTVYLIIGILYVLLPLTVWAVLYNQPARSAALWCVGGELLGIGLLLLGLRGYLPAWMSYPLANVVMWTGVLIQIMALRRALQQSLALKRSVLLIVACVAVFEFSELFCKMPFCVSRGRL